MHSELNALHPIPRVLGSAARARWIAYLTLHDLVTRRSGGGSRRAAGRSASRRGFTLVELLVVLIVLGIAVAVGAPALPRAGFGAASASDQLMRILYRAGRMAAERGRTVRVELDPDASAYRVRMEATGSAEGALIASGSFGAGSRDSIFSLADNGSAVPVFRFDPLGRAEGGPVIVDDGRGEGVIVAVDPWTGRVHVEPR